MNNKKKKSKKWIIILIILVVVVGGFWACGKAASQVNLNFVETAMPEKGNLEEFVNVTGIVESEEIKNYFAPVSGKIQEVYVKQGDSVKEGMELLAYDMTDMERYLEQAKLQYITGNSTYNGTLANNNDMLTDLQEANTNLPILEQQIKDETAYIKELQKNIQDIQTNTANTYAARSLNIQKELVELQKDPVANQDAIMQLQVELETTQYQAQTQGITEEQQKLQEKIEEEQEKLATYEKHKAEMEAQKQKAEASLLTSYQKENLSASEQLNLMSYESAQQDYEIAEQGIKAAFDGIVTEISVIEGIPVGENAQLLVLANTNAVKVSFSVGKYDLAKIAVGQKTDIEINGHAYSGKITKIDKIASMSASGNTQVGAQVHIDNPDDNIILGLDAKLKILTNKAEDILLIPVVALNADKSGDFVYVVEENGVVVRKDIVTGISSAEEIEVKEGLGANDKVIVSSLVALEEGMQVVEMPTMITE